MRIGFLLVVLGFVSGSLGAQRLAFAVDVRTADAQLRGWEALDLSVAPDGQWWLATQDEGVLRYDGTSLFAAEWPGVPPIVLAVAPVRGAAYAATSDGLVRVGMDQSVQPVHPVQGAVVDAVSHGDSVWVLGADCLWFCAPGGSWQRMSVDGLRGARSFGRRGGAWWISAQSGLFVRGTSGRWTRVRDWPVASAAVDAHGIWAVSDSGLERLTDDGWKRVRASAPQDIRWVAAAAPGAWWAASAEGLWWVDAAPRPMFALSGLPLEAAVSLAPDGNGGLLLVQRDGVLRIPRPEQWFDVRTAAYNMGRIAAATRIGTDSLVLLTTQGIRVLGPSSVRTLALPEQGLTSGVLALGTGRWLAFGEYGAWEWIRSKWRPVVSEWVLAAREHRDSAWIQTASGWSLWNGTKFIPSPPPSHAETEPPKAWDESGYQWVWADRGMSVRASGRGVPPLGLPRWVLRSFEVQSAPRSTAVLRFVRMGEQVADRRALRYRLSGGDWVDVGAARTISLSGLGPGRHLVELDSDPIQQFTVFVPAPWWGQPRFWVPALAALLLAGVVLLLMLLRRRREARKWAREKAELERMALRLQMNPHFTFNALESISSFVMEQKPREAVQYLHRFARLMRYTLEKAELERVPLQDELDALAHYIALEQMRFDQSFDYVLEVEEGFELGDFALPPMLLQPLVENAILHGLRPLQGRRGCLTLRVGLARSTDRVQVEVEDNGIGRLAASAQRTGDEGQKRSMATHILERRLQALGTSRGTEYGLEVADLNEGTRVVLALPKDEVWGA